MDGGPAGRQGYVVTMLTRVLVIMVMRCCNMTSSSNCPSEKAKEFDSKPHKTNVMVLTSEHIKACQKWSSSRIKYVNMCL